MNSKHQRGHMLALALALTLELTVTLIILSHANAATSVAKPGCEQECGGITIPYPFGIGNSSCYYDQWFEIVCKETKTNNETTNAAGARPFLKRVNLEVLELRIATSSDPTGWIYANNPIVASSPNCSAGKPSTSAAVVNLTGSPFYYSRGYNSFGAAGCNNEVWMTGGSQVVGCNSTCNSNTGILGNCCETAVPSSLRVFKVSFSDPAAAGCKYGFIAQSKWFKWYPSSTCNAAVLDLDSVPAWLEWGFYNSTPEAVVLAEQSARDNSPVGCTYYTYDDGLVLQYCYCSQGFQGNPYLQDGCQDIDECQDPPSDCKGTCKNTLGSYKCSSAKSINVIHIVIIVGGPLVGVLVLIMCIWAIFNHIDSRKKQTNFKRNEGLLLSSDKNTKTYTVKELKKATNNFHRKNMLGKGGQGTVYKGMISIDGNGTAVAVKKCKKIEPVKPGKSAAREEDHSNIHMNPFITEVINLSKTKHNNIVKLLGCCLETEAPMLVYEHVANGDLSNHLHGHKNKHGSFSLSWEARLRIAAEAARGFSYLHSDADHVPIYHRDIKSANILLDNKNIAKIADFGISTSVSSDQTLVNVADVVGSRGYIDPQYNDSKQYSDKSDVYSFGVVLAELLTGREPLLSPKWQEARDRTVTLLAHHFKSMELETIVSSFLDPRVESEARDTDHIKAVVILTKRCLSSQGSDRPSMKEVSTELERIKKLHEDSYGDTNKDDFEGVLRNANASIEDQQTKPLRAQQDRASDGFDG